MDKILELFISYIGQQLPEIGSFCLKVIIAIFVFCIGRKVIAKLLNFMKKSLEHAGVDTGVIQFGNSISKVAMYAFLIFAISTNFGVKETSVAALISASGLTIGLGLQGGLTNLAGGLIILLFRPYEIGDYIIMDNSSSGVEGTILKIEMFYTTLATVDNRTIVIPNGTLSNSCVINVTAKNSRKLEIKVGISYESSIARAKEILEKLLREDPCVMSDQEILVFVDELASNSVVLGLRAWVSTEEYWKTKWRMNEKIKESFEEAGVVIPYPQMDVHIKEPI